MKVMVLIFFKKKFNALDETKNRMSSAENWIIMEIKV